MKLLIIAFAIFGSCYCFGNNRIVGGNEVTIDEYPHQISLQYIDKHICGGSIVSPKYIITAAHCTNEKVAKFLYIRAGSSLKDEGGIELNITQVIQHPEFDPKTYDYDISILELKTPLSFSDKIQPIGLPTKNSALKPGTLCTVTGWGYEQPGTHFTDHLRGVSLPVVEHKTCEDYYKPFNEEITDRMFCAGFENGGKDACQGDSGGPLILSGKLVGVVSWGEGCATPKQPGVFANVAYFRDFISERTGL